MAQLAKKRSTSIKSVKPKRPSPKVRKKAVKVTKSAERHANDNVWTSMSDLPWKKQAAILNRMADLQWQINFTQMKLQRWANLDNGDWTHLKYLNKAAKAELKDLTYI